MKENLYRGGYFYFLLLSLSLLLGLNNQITANTPESSSTAVLQLKIDPIIGISNNSNKSCTIKVNFIDHSIVCDPAKIVMCSNTKCTLEVKSTHGKLQTGEDTGVLSQDYYIILTECNSPDNSQLNLLQGQVTSAPRVIGLESSTIGKEDRAYFLYAYPTIRNQEGESNMVNWAEQLIAGNYTDELTLTLTPIE
ncbi:MAG: hypothetical protein K0S74_103 [Chlamydiales bacterium]|jgi:hypothetical protein|nr:hypothetical protein [Chlamydiales bacterium]